MLPLMVASLIRWFRLGGTLTALTPAGAFALGEKGWRSSNRAVLEAEGDRIEEAVALEVWAEELAKFGAQPSVLSAATE
jgi:hypothetical protein